MRTKILKMLPRSRVEDCPFHFSINHQIVVGPKGGGASLAYADTRWRAEIVADALNAFRRTPAGRQWWRRIQGKGRALPETKRCERCHTSPCLCRMEEVRNWDTSRLEEEVATLTRTLRFRKKAERKALQQAKQAK
jgi:hypothetical protein